MIIFEKIFSIISYYLAFYFEYINICNISKDKHQFKKKNFFFIGVIAAINYLLTISGLITIKMIFSFLSLFLISKILVSKEYRESLVISTIYYIIILLVEYMSSFLLIDVMKYNPQRFLISVGIQKCIIGHIINIISYIICKIPIANKIYMLICNIIDRSGISNSKIYFIIGTLFVIHLMYMNNVSGNLNVLYVALYILIFIIFIILLILTMYKNYYLKELNALLVDRDKELQIMLDEYKTFQHNIKNDLLAISSIGNKRVKEMVGEYLSAYHIDIDGKNNIGSMPDGLRGIIYQKLIHQNKVSTTILIDNFIQNDPIKFLSIKEYRKLVESFGIIIDNALEAVTSNKDDYIYLYFNESSDSYTIKCINPFSSIIEVDEIMNMGVSTKNGHSGIGINYIKCKTKFDFNIKIINNKFLSELHIKK